MINITLAAHRRLEVTDCPPPPDPGPHEVLLRVLSVGLCGSDVHYFTKGRIGSQVVRYPFRLGHEFSAIVEATGQDVLRVTTGNRVVVDPAMSCYICEQCRIGRPHTCRKLRFLGCPGQSEGCLCSLILMPEETCFSIPNAIDNDLAALVEPLAIGAYAARLSGRLMGAHVAILGCGPIGLCAMLALKAIGVEKVYMTDPVAERRVLASELGAHWVGHPVDDPPVETLKALEPFGLDAVFECCGQQSAIDQAVAMLTPGGKLFLIGIPTEDRVSFPIDTIRRNEIAIQNVRRQNGCMREAIQLAVQKQDQLRRLITHVGTPDRAQHFFELLEAYREGIVKAIVQF